MSDWDSPVWLDVQVRRRWMETGDTVALELASVQGQPLSTFEAGACVDVLFPGGAVRAYSLANAPHARDHYLLGVRLEPQGQGGSRTMHALRVGDRLRVSRPRNSFPLHGGALHHVLLAGGIGITPMLSMAAHLWRTAASFELHHGFRSPEQAPFLAHVREAPYARHVSHWCSAPGAQGRMAFSRILARVPALSHVYLCGPAAFMEAGAATAAGLGWPAERLHQESFDAAHRAT
ncbi:ferredoxin reductase [Hydrogenophaga laconesensis]|uniref:Vanillate O-demethylase ferredoxin subunit n=1 Tax=Hydrogenophaga laconesensis TaxID=1805971 RepID=A0ABU1VD14_9BURK|nr:ferredoxin reductase [Hydrogenophaga laconesensis]MDR7095337.1 vanillate O-demethylase ferredoxin subunit [Hydrogenophaga laconesensis]